MSDIDRRDFLLLTGGALASAALGGCASLATIRVQPVDGAVRLPLRNHPRLSVPGGSLKILPEGAHTPLYVLALEGGEYIVVSPICTHLGCTVNIEAPRLVCPCHGSIYDWEGNVLQGPAERPLARIPSTLTADGTLVIELGRSG